MAIVAFPLRSAFSPASKPPTRNTSVSYFAFGNSALGLLPLMVAPPSHVGNPGMPGVHTNTSVLRYSANVPDAVTAAVTRHVTSLWHDASAKNSGTVSVLVLATRFLEW